MASEQYLVISRHMQGGLTTMLRLSSFAMSKLNSLLQSSESVFYAAGDCELLFCTGRHGIPSELLIRAALLKPKRLSHYFWLG